jgi:hypothetical protein
MDLREAIRELGKNRRTKDRMENGENYRGGKSTVVGRLPKRRFGELPNRSPPVSVWPNQLPILNALCVILGWKLWDSGACKVKEEDLNASF